MFVEHKEAVEITEAPAKVLTLSNAIRKGLTLIEENAGIYLTEKCGCALGLAAVGYGHKARSTTWTPLFDFVSEKSGLSRDFLEKMEDRHVVGERAASIANWLESQGL